MNIEDAEHGSDQRSGRSKFYSANMSYPIALASDHAGVWLKSALLFWLSTQRRAALNLGVDDAETPVDYPDIATKMDEAIREHHAANGILICSSGIGMSIAANRYQTLRAALCKDKEMAHLARAHNNANVLVLGARFTQKEEDAINILYTFLHTPFEGGRHARRVSKIISKTD